MPKDKNQAKNKSRFEVRGGVINEFDFHQNQRALAEEEQNRFVRLEEERRLRESETQAAAPQTEGEYLQQLMTEVHEKVQRRRDKDSKPGATRPARARGAAKKATKSSAKGAVKKGGAKKARAAQKVVAGNTKKGGAKSAATKARAGKKSAKRTGGTKTRTTLKATGKKSGAKKVTGRATRKSSRAR